MLRMRIVYDIDIDLECINDIFNPMEKVERQIAKPNISAIYGCCYSVLTNHQTQLSVDGFYVDSQYRVWGAADGGKIFCH